MQADWYIGAITVFDGLVGTALGGLSLDYLIAKFPQSNRIVVALVQMCVCIAISIPFCIMAFVLQNPRSFPSPSPLQLPTAAYICF